MSLDQSPQLPVTEDAPVQLGGADVIVNLPTGVLSFKAGPTALLLLAQGDVPTFDLPHGQGVHGVILGLLRTHCCLAGRFVGEEDIVGVFDAGIEAGDARLSLKDVAQPGQDWLEPVVLQLGFDIVGELGLFSSIEPLQPGQKRFGFR